MKQSHRKIIDNKFDVITTATKCRNLFCLNYGSLNLSLKENHAAMKCGSTDRTKESIWNKRYGYLGARNLERLANEQPVHGSDYEQTMESSHCEPFVDGK